MKLKLIYTILIIIILIIIIQSDKQKIIELKDAVNNYLAASEGIIYFSDINNVLLKKFDRKKYYFLNSLEESEDSSFKFEMDSITYENKKKLYEMYINNDFINKKDTSIIVYAGGINGKTFKYLENQPAYNYFLSNNRKKSNGIKYADVKVKEFVNISDLIVNKKDTMIFVEYITQTEFLYDWILENEVINKSYEFSLKYTSADSLILKGGKWRVSLRHRGIIPYY